MNQTLAAVVGVLVGALLSEAACIVVGEEMGIPILSLTVISVGIALILTIGSGIYLVMLTIRAVGTLIVEAIREDRGRSD